MNKTKRFGQHFLADEQVIQQLIRIVAPTNQDHFVEIGPGQGILTTALLPNVKQLDAIEIDRDLIPLLQRRCRDIGDNLKIHNIDILQFDLAALPIVSNEQKLRIVGNLPYNISTPILFYVIKNIRKIKDLYFMVQKEVAERIVAPPNSKTYGRLSVMLQYYFDAALVLDIPPEAFNPPPKVHSSFIKLIPREIINAAKNPEQFATTVKMAFSQRRKTIYNNLKMVITEQQLKALAINPKARAENLTVDDFVAISNSLD